VSSIREKIPDCHLSYGHGQAARNSWERESEAPRIIFGQLDVKEAMIQMLLFLGSEGDRTVRARHTKVLV
jgi:hypothetical protein